MNFVIKPFASCGSLSKSPATVFVSVACSKFFASFAGANIWQLEVKAAVVFIDNSDSLCNGFSEKR